MKLTSKQSDLLAKYISDISKLFFGGVFLKQFFNPVPDYKELVYTLIASLVLLVVALLIQPKE